MFTPLVSSLVWLGVDNATYLARCDSHPASLRGTGRGGGRDTQLHPTTLTRVGLRQEHGGVAQIVERRVHIPNADGASPFSVTTLCPKAHE